jgi:hypothetical protein
MGGNLYSNGTVNNNNGGNNIARDNNYDSNTANIGPNVPVSSPRIYNQMKEITNIQQNHFLKENYMTNN